MSEFLVRGVIIISIISIRTIHLINIHLMKFKEENARNVITITRMRAIIRMKILSILLRYFENYFNLLYSGASYKKVKNLIIDYIKQHIQETKILRNQTDHKRNLKIEMKLIIMEVQNKLCYVETNKLSQKNSGCHVC